ncbi:hypothetical protein [Cellulomonas sp. ACRRI]|uniref:hypothetical protein n=1 Tax=Cellulomonas sp. ACRRI TaxID=2918188 RepID=UPI0035B13DBA
MVAGLPPDWTGESGYVDAAVLARHLPPGFERFQFFTCGPVPMLESVSAALAGLGVPLDHIHTECFGWV